MITAKGTFGDEKMILLGLSRRNTELLLQGKPIRLNHETHPGLMPEGLVILLMGGETEIDIVKALRELDAVDHETELKIQPRAVEDQHR